MRRIAHSDHNSRDERLHMISAFSVMRRAQRISRFASARIIYATAKSDTASLSLLSLWSRVRIRLAAPRGVFIAIAFRKESLSLSSYWGTASGPFANSRALLRACPTVLLALNAAFKQMCLPA